MANKRNDDPHPGVIILHYACGRLDKHSDGHAPPVYAIGLRHPDKNWDDIWTGPMPETEILTQLVSRLNIYPDRTIVG